MAREARGRKDSAQWELGDLAVLVETHYGQNEIDNFARETGISKSSAHEYKSMCAFYQTIRRADFLESTPNVFYSHFRVAKKLKSVELAWEFLELVAAETWTVDQAEFHMYEDEPFASVMREDEPDDSDDEPEPTPILSDAPVIVCEIDRKANEVTFRMTDSYLDMLAEEKNDEFLLTLTRR
jgi:hypothetical protein